MGAGLLGNAGLAIRTIRVEITDTVRTVGAVGVTGAATTNSAHTARTTVFAASGARHAVARPLVGSVEIARASGERAVKLTACQTASSLARAHLIRIAESVRTIVIKRAG